ncbi:hypothetical protein TPHA_0G00820 [Tetrapisispora phaffii CBS 4417]|uniref:C2H2-type domain-containing protein n=1 Tax=Tetrapisispora phaffii (strain ATCC 24235 / CBS 4417 / NBRC 1672 / NRRL Y-8282 / UCD 70-5) TaxID=1071381 RepID=G8BVJ0_TETPH|nr:hypothetical protein TPHA_0G00820 [Tetrapisispora phaffii CBS 4417]CCE63918.1 hypothetical protein TPHA_0G00820 [Tetrapisispora phaffii CBS 4417]
MSDKHLNLLDDGQIGDEDMQVFLTELSLPSGPNRQLQLGMESSDANKNMSLDIQTFKNSWNEEQTRYLSPIPQQNCGNGVEGGDNESVYSSSSFVNNNGTENNLVPLSPAVSYLTTGEEEHDDLSSIYSGSSNNLFPVDSHGFKHATGLEDIDLLMMGIKDSVGNEFENTALFDVPVGTQHTHINEGLASSGNTTPFTPTIGLNDFIDSSIPQEINHILDDGLTSPAGLSVPIINIEGNNEPSLGFNDNPASFQSSNTNIYNVTPQINSNKLVVTVDDGKSSLLTDMSNDLDKVHNEMRQGRQLKGRRSISRRSSRTRSISPESKARSLSANRDKLLEMADLLPDSPPVLNSQSKNTMLSFNANVKQEFPSDLNTQGKLESAENSFLSAEPKSPLEEGETPQNLSGTTRRRNSKKNPSIYDCVICEKKFTRPYNLRSHLRTHTNERPFVCTVCGKAFAREHDRKRHEDLHTGKKRYICGGKLKSGEAWGCGKKFARSDALGRHFKTESGKKCITPLYEEAARERETANNSSN